MPHASFLGSLFLWGLKRVKVSRTACGQFTDEHHVVFPVGACYDQGGGGACVTRADAQNKRVLNTPRFWVTP